MSVIGLIKTIEDIKLEIKIIKETLDASKPCYNSEYGYYNSYTVESYLHDLDCYQEKLDLLISGFYGYNEDDMIAENIPLDYDPSFDDNDLTFLE